MKKQVCVIHGGNAFNSYDEYLLYLKSKNLTLADLQYKDWKHILPQTLGDEYEVLAPRMPSGNNAKYLEWKIWFEKLIPLFSDSVLLVGHSLGGIFLAKFLSEEEFPKHIAGVFLIAAPFNTVSQHPLADFILTDDIHMLAERADRIFLYHSRDDVVVPFENFEQYAAKLPDAEQRVFEKRGHMNQEDFPELIEDILALKW